MLLSLDKVKLLDAKTQVNNFGDTSSTRSKLNFARIAKLRAVQQYGKGA